MSTMESVYENFIGDLVYSLRERAAEAESEARSTDAEFVAGQALGLRQALARMQNEADAFGLDKARLGLDGFDAMTGPIAPPPPRER